jgi:hypothetical protein
MTQLPDTKDAEVTDVKLTQELAFYLRAAFEYIDAIPDDIASRFPGMPGLDRDAAESVLDTAEKRHPKEPKA